MVGQVVNFPIITGRSNEAVGFYTARDAARIARVPLHRLYSWKRIGIVLPTIEEIDPDQDDQVGYTFEAVVYLRILRMLRDKSVSLEKAVMAVKHLRDRFGSPSADWVNARVFMYGREVIVASKDKWESTVATRSGQKVAVLLLGEEFVQLRERADALLIPIPYQSYVEIRPEVRSGLPVIRDTTIQTATIQQLRERKISLVKIREHYPCLSAAQIKAAIGYERLLSAEAA